MIHHPISFAEYRSIPGIAQSLLRHIDRSPRHLKYARDAQRSPTPAMLAGSLTDHLLFGTEFSYVVSPYHDFRSREAQAWRDDQESAGVAVIKQATVDEIAVVVGNIRHHPAVRELLNAGRSQVALTAKLGDIEAKGLVDWISDEVACLVDLKTTTDASPRQWARHVIDMGYDAQAEYYLRLWEANSGESLVFVWIVGETEPPFETAVYIAPPEAIARGREINNARLTRYAAAQKNDFADGYGDNPQTLTLPAWAVPKEH